MHPLDMNHILSTWIFSCDLKYIPVFLWQEFNPYDQWQELYTFDRHLNLVTGIVFMWQKFISCERKLLWLVLLQNYFRGSAKNDFLWGLKILCQPGCQVDRDYPTLLSSHCAAFSQVQRNFQFLYLKYFSWSNILSYMWINQIMTVCLVSYDKQIWLVGNVHWPAIAYKQIRK